MAASRNGNSLLLRTLIAVVGSCIALGASAAAGVGLAHALDRSSHRTRQEVIDILKPIIHEEVLRAIQDLKLDVKEIDAKVDRLIEAQKR